MGDGVVDGPPDVDDAYTRLEQPLSVLGEVVLDALERGVVRLIDVNALLNMNVNMGTKLTKWQSDVQQDHDGDQPLPAPHWRQACAYSYMLSQ